jgi:hypothetical protein
MKVDKYYHFLTPIRMKNITLTAQLSQEIFNVTQKYTKELSRPQQFNFREIIRGILVSGSTYLSQIGRVNGASQNERKTVERFSNTLSKIPTEKFANIHIQSQMNKYKDEPVLILSDGGDIQKPYAKKMEKVCKNVDGSNGHKTGTGYPLHVLMALGVDSGDLSALSLHTYSTLDEYFKSEWDEQKKSFEHLRLSIFNSAFDKIIVEDRGCDDGKRFVYFVKDLEASFVTRIHVGAKSRIFMIQNENSEFEEIKVNELAEKFKSKAGAERSWWNKKVKAKLTSRIAFQKVYLPKHLDIPLYAVFCYSEGYSEPLVVLTDLETDSYEKAWKHFFYYKKRWEVENFYRAIKQQFNAEDFLILDFEKIKALMFSVMLAYSLLLNIKERTMQFLGLMYELFLDFCKRKQRSGKHQLDILAFIRDYFTQPETSNFYRFYSCQFRKILYSSTKNQLKMFDFRKNW